MGRQAADSAQLALVEVADSDPRPAQAPGRRRTGRHEREFYRAVRAAGLDQRPAMAASVSAARAAAWALDTAEAKGNAYAVAQLLRPYQDLLTALQLVPVEDTGGEDDPFADLAGPALGDAAHPDPADAGE